jgi:hypothetical protein
MTAQTSCCAEDELRYRYEALEERVRNRQRRGDDSKHLRRPVQHRRETDGDETECCKQGQRFHWQHRAGCNRPGSSAFDIRVDVAVDIVVEYAARGAHDDDTENEHDEQARVRMTVAGQP